MKDTLSSKDHSIIRQSSLKAALEFMSICKPSELTIKDVLDISEQFETWICAAPQNKDEVAMMPPQGMKCDKGHDMKHVPAGISKKTGKHYNAFYSCDICKTTKPVAYSEQSF